MCMCIHMFLFNPLSYLHFLVILFLNLIRLLLSCAKYLIQNRKFNLNIELNLNRFICWKTIPVIKAISAASNLYRSPTIRVQDS